MANLLVQRFAQGNKFYTDKEITNTDAEKGVVGTFKTTFGQIVDADTNDFICYCLERRDTLIPEGTYPFTFYYSPENKLTVPLLHDVPNFSYVEVHPANWAYLLKGCVAPCTEIDISTPMGAGSRVAWQKVMGLLNNKEGNITYETLQQENT